MNEDQFTKLYEMLKRIAVSLESLDKTATAAANHLQIKVKPGLRK